jgi:hypothetical protein
MRLIFQKKKAIIRKPQPRAHEDRADELERSIQLHRAPRWQWFDP